MPLLCLSLLLLLVMRLLGGGSAVALRYDASRSDGQQLAVLSALSPVQCGLLCAGQRGCVEVRLGSGGSCSLLGCAAGWLGRLGGCLWLDGGEPLSWPAAEQACGEYRGGAHLSSVLSGAEMRLLTRLANSSGLQDVHIGLVHRPELRPAGSGGWLFRWSDGRRLEFTAWAPNEPSGNSSNTKYGSIRSESGVWVVNTNRHVANHFICKYYP